MTDTPATGKAMTAERLEDIREIVARRDALASAFERRVGYPGQRESEMLAHIDAQAAESAALKVSLAKSQEIEGLALGQVKETTADLVALTSQIAAIKAELVTARERVLEEAAKAIEPLKITRGSLDRYDNYHNDAIDRAAKIVRALKGQTP